MSLQQQLRTAALGGFVALLAAEIYRRSRAAAAPSPPSPSRRGPRESSSPRPPWQRSSSLHGAAMAQSLSSGCKRVSSFAPRLKPPRGRTAAHDNSDSDDDGTEALEQRVEWLLPRKMMVSIIVFGADGNLASKKILPTLFKLWRRGHLPRDAIVVGFAQPPSRGGKLKDSAQFRVHVRQCVEAVEGARAVLSSDALAEFLLRCHFHCGLFGNALSMQRLADMLARLESTRKVARTAGLQWLSHIKAKDPSPIRQQQVRMYYFSVPPFLYHQICSALLAARKREALLPRRPSGESIAGQDVFPQPLPIEERFVLEKPFGKDTESCAQMVEELSMLREDQSYFIDHYLGKELVMNLLVLRFANVCFGAIWNRQHIKSVQVIFKEDIGTEGRGGYFDQYGIIRDVMQNHLLQMLALIAMEQPLSLSAEDIRSEKLKVLKACKPLSLDDLVVGQYVRNGDNPGYLEDPSIANKESTTETFAAAVLHVHNPRWDGVPFVLKAGKALTESKVELRIQFHSVPGVVSALSECAANELVVRVQPEECIYWKVQHKVPDLTFKVKQMRMDFQYSSKYIKSSLPEAYERLLLECLAADHSHFVSSEELLSSWRIFTPALHEMQQRNVKPEPYLFGTRGPAAADHLARRYGMKKFGGGLTPYIFASEMQRNNSGTINEVLHSSPRDQGDSPSRRD